MEKICRFFRAANVVSGGGPHDPGGIIIKDMKNIFNIKMKIIFALEPKNKQKNREKS